IFKKGIISRKTEEMKLGSIETVEIDQGVIGRLLGFGTVRVTGRGISDVTFTGVDDPMDVKRRIESESHPAA
ncbi:MAG TPA: PH domain-containing protein, partial [Gammaproteobacteria bacterium]